MRRSLLRSTVHATENPPILDIVKVHDPPRRGSLHPRFLVEATMDAIQPVRHVTVLRQIHQQFTRRVVDLAAGDVVVAARHLKVPAQTLVKDLRGFEGGKIDKVA